MTEIAPLLSHINTQCQLLFGQGNVANYIPELAKIKPQQFAMAVLTVDGETYTTGDAKTRFSIQSISKVLTL